MKKVLLSLALLGSVLMGRAQVILNEFFTDASINTKQNPNQFQFFELFNTGNADVDLSCYSIVSVGYSNLGVINAIHIIDLPDGMSIPAKGYFTAAASATSTLGTRTLTPTYNWSAIQQPAGASFKKYTVTGATLSGPVLATGDFFINNNGNTKIAVFLFDGSIKSGLNNAVTYVNGFIAYGNLTNPAPSPALPGVPSAFNFSTLQSLPNPTAACSPSVIDWKKVITSEYSGASGGSGHGYYRAGNGACGTWNKVSDDNNFSPNARNPIATGSNIESGNLITSENIVCDQEKVVYKIFPTAGVEYPLSIEMYYDEINNGYLDAGEFQNSVNNVFSIPYEGSFKIIPGKKVFLVYKTPLGCASKIVTPLPTTGSISSTERFACGFVHFRVDALNGAANTYASSVNVNLYGRDANNVLSSVLATQTISPSTDFSRIDVTSISFNAYTSYQLEYVIPGFT
jgi:hypothetical protein